MKLNLKLMIGHRRERKGIDMPNATEPRKKPSIAELHNAAYGTKTDENGGNPTVGESSFSEGDYEHHDSEDCASEVYD